MSHESEFIEAYSNYLNAKKEAKAKNMAVREVQHQLDGITIALDKAKEDLIEAKKKERSEKKFLHKIINKPLFKRAVNDHISTAIKDSIRTFIEANGGQIISAIIGEVVSPPVSTKQEPELK